MANHKSAEKRFRRDEKRRVLNHQRVARIRTFIKKVEKAILTGVKVDAQNAFKLAMPEAMKGVTKDYCIRIQFLVNYHACLIALKRLLSFKFLLFLI